MEVILHLNQLQTVLLRVKTIRVGIRSLPKTVYRPHTRLCSR